MDKKLLLGVLILLLPVLSLFAQQAGCCSKAQEKEERSSTSQFARLSEKEGFVESHAEPLPYKHQTEKGKEITYTTPDGQTARAFAYLAEEESDKYLLLIHEWWGLNDYVRKEAEKYYEHLGNVHVIALDLYDGRVATTQAVARQYTQEVGEERARAIIKGAIQMAGPQAEIATLGWCFGGGWALQAAMMADEQAAACVMYYGMPELEVSRLRRLECPVLGIFASRDEWITPAVVESFEQKMEKAGKEVRIQMYDAPHAFANPSNPAYDRQAAAEAYQVARRFLEIHL